MGEAERLVSMKIHPQTIVAGWRKAIEVAVDALNEIATDNSGDPTRFRRDLLNIARTTLCSKIVNVELDYFAEMCVDAVLRLNGQPIEMIQIIKKLGGQLKDSFLDDGFILDKEFGVGQKKVLENPKILIANTPMDTDKIKIMGAKVRTSSVQKVHKILNHEIDLFINRQLIYNYPEEIMTDAGVS